MAVALICRTDRCISIRSPVPHFSHLLLAPYQAVRYNRLRFETRTIMGCASNNEFGDEEGS